MPLTSSRGTPGAVPGRTVTRSGWPSTTMLRITGAAARRRKLIGIGRYRSITYRPGAASSGGNWVLPSPSGRSFSPPLRFASHNE